MLDFLGRLGSALFCGAQHWGLWNSHPFTVANIPEGIRENGHKKIQLITCARCAFTRKLLRGATSAIVTAFLTGLCGRLSTWNSYEILILISVSVGTSFPLPILESILNNPCCVGRIDWLLLIRHKSHFEGYLSQLRAAASHPRLSEVRWHIMIAITGKQADPICKNDAT